MNFLRTAWLMETGLLVYLNFFQNFWPPLFWDGSDMWYKYSGSNYSIFVGDARLTISSNDYLKFVIFFVFSGSGYGASFTGQAGDSGHRGWGQWCEHDPGGTCGHRSNGEGGKTGIWWKHREYISKFLFPKYNKNQGTSLLRIDNIEINWTLGLKSQFKSYLKWIGEENDSYFHFCALQILLHALGFFYLYQWRFVVVFQAVRCSDYAIARFCFLQRALLVHGHWYYNRISILVLYFFYKVHTHPLFALKRV